MTNEELKIDALKDTYYEAGYGADYILEMLVLVRGEEFCREHFPEFYDDEEEEEEKEELCKNCDETYPGRKEPYCIMVHKNCGKGLKHLYYEEEEKEHEVCPDCNSIDFACNGCGGCCWCGGSGDFNAGCECEEEEEKEECETCCLTECACSVCECCSSLRSHYKEMCDDCGKCNGIDKGSNVFNAKCCECVIPDETVFKCFECSVEIKRNSREHDNCKTANGVDWYCEDCDIPDEDDEEDEEQDVCVGCECGFDQRKMLNDANTAIVWGLYCDGEDQDGDLCAKCLTNWETNNN